MMSVAAAAAKKNKGRTTVAHVDRPEFLRGKFEEFGKNTAGERVHLLDGRVIKRLTVPSHRALTCLAYIGERNDTCAALTVAEDEKLGEDAAKDAKDGNSRDDDRKARDDHPKDATAGILIDEHLRIAKMDGKLKLFWATNANKSSVKENLRLKGDIVKALDQRFRYTERGLEACYSLGTDDVCTVLYSSYATFRDLDGKECVAFQRSGEEPSSKWLKVKGVKVRIPIFQYCFIERACVFRLVQATQKEVRETSIGKPDVYIVSDDASLALIHALRILVTCRQRKLEAHDLLGCWNYCFVPKLIHRANGERDLPEAVKERLYIDFLEQGTDLIKHCTELVSNFLQSVRELKDENKNWSDDFLAEVKFFWRVIDELEGYASSPALPDDPLHEWLAQATEGNAMVEKVRINPDFIEWAGRPDTQAEGKKCQHAEIYLLNRGTNFIGISRPCCPTCQFYIACKQQAHRVAHGHSKFHSDTTGFLPDDVGPDDEGIWRAGIKAVVQEKQFKKFLATEKENNWRGLSEMLFFSGPKLINEKVMMAPSIPVIYHDKGSAYIVARRLLEPELCLSKRIFIPSTAGLYRVIRYLLSQDLAVVGKDDSAFGVFVPWSMLPVLPRAEVIARLFGGVEVIGIPGDPHGSEAEFETRHIILKMIQSIAELDIGSTIRESIQNNALEQPSEEFLHCLLIHNAWRYKEATGSIRPLLRALSMSVMFSVLKRIRIVLGCIALHIFSN